MITDKHKIKETFKFLEENEKILSQSAVNFVHTLKKYFARNKSLSEKQVKILTEIRNNL